MEKESNVQEQKLNTNVSLEVIKKSINTELLRNGWEEFSKQVASVPFTEENLPVLRDLKAKFKTMFDAIEKAHETGKRPYLDVTQRYDAAKRDLNKVVNEAFNPFKANFDKLCREIEENNRKLQQELERKAAIQKAIENNVIFCSEKIAKAETVEELKELRKAVEKHSSDKDKYQEFFPQAKLAFEKILVMLDAQVKHLEELEKVNKKLTKKIKSEHDRLSLQEHQENLKSQIEENKIVVQEEAVNVTMNQEVIEAAVVPTEIKPKRSVWKWEVSDLDEMERTGFVVKVPNEDAVNNYLKLQKPELEKMGKDEVIMDGIRFYLHKEY